MADDRDPASLIDAAQRAAAAGDYAEAERLLRDAADLQETAVGPSDPDLATTLNNLAFVCERNRKFDEAERGYRRAHKIAVASLSPGHPFIKTSLSNLMEFCEARGIPIWTRPETPVEDEPLHDDGDVETALEDGDVERPPITIPPQVVNDSAIVNEPSVARRFPPRMMAVAALAVVAIAVVVLARQGQGTTETPPPSPPPSPVTSPAPNPAPGPALSPVPNPVPSPARQSVTVLKAQLCSALEKRGSPDWQCASVSGDQKPGTYMFYTRLQATSSTTVEHRWYRGSRVHQVMRLRVPATPRSGYRTFSSNTVSAERAGEWKVELRAADGSLLDEARFVVR